MIIGVRNGSGQLRWLWYGVCIDQRGAILLSRHAPPDGRWVLPGGGVEYGGSGVDPQCELSVLRRRGRC
ncbi:NUDIX domain-containing protein [Microlunatus endophyticus]|uniref:NUDIX domain-containing protein n=1 Tax=Microlunatus endophyticus TaxID=1716077 RepID=UPI003570D13B